MKVGTFFSGVGSPEQAMRNLDIKHQIEFACDIDKYAKETYLKNFKPKLFATDITTLDMKNLPYVDLLVFGFPCQAFSMAGKRKGFNDTRGTLFYDALRYLREHRPRYFIAENVKGLVSHDNGKTFRTIIDCLAKTTNYQMSLMPFDNLGYHIHYKVLNTKNFGIPQNRERIFIIGIRDNKDNNFNFPKEIPLKLKLKDILQDNPNSKYYLSDKMIQSISNTNYTSGKPQSIQIVGYIQGKCKNAERETNAVLSPNGIGMALTAQGGGNTSGRAIRVEGTGEDDLISHSLYPRSGDPTKGGTGHLSKSDGTAYCLDTGNNQAIELQRLEDVKLTATKRVNETPKEINEFLRKHKNISIQEIADKLNIPKTQAEHYFRTDKYRTIPSREIWNKLKELLNFDSRYDKQVCEIEQSEYSFESSSRLYSDNGLGATLQTTENTLYKTQSRIRKLTPIECERLQGFPDNFTEGVSDTQRYKQMGNTITVNVIQAILNKLLL